MSLSNDEFEANWKEILELVSKLAASGNLDDVELIRTIKVEGLAEMSTKDSDQLDASSKAADLKKKANDYFNTKQYAKAIELYSKALLVPKLSAKDYAILYSNRSVAYVESGNPAKAYVDAKLAQQHWPNWFKAYLRKGVALHHLGKYKQAVKAFDLALVLDPANKEVQAARGESNAQLQKQERYDHLDATMLPTTLEQELKRANLNISADSYRKLIDERIQKGDPAGQLAKGIDLINLGQLDEGVRWVSAAASNGHVEAMYNLAVLYMNGRGVQRDMQVAKMWLEKAANSPPEAVVETNSGIGLAEHALGNMYLEGNGVPRDIHIAVMWLKRSANHGCAFGQNDLGVQYQDGHGVPQDYERAYQYYHLAASKGNARSMLNIARLCMAGLGTLRDGTKAYQWYTKASQSGFKLADSEIEAAKALMKREQEILSEMQIPEKSDAELEHLTTAERIEKYKTHEMRLMEEVMKATRAKSPNSVSLEDKFSLEVLEKYASKSSTAAKLLEAKKFYLTAVKVAQSNGDDLEVATLLANSFRISEIVSGMLPETASLLLRKTEKAVTANPSSVDACYSYAWMQLRHTMNLQYCDSYLQKCIGKFPKAYELHHLRGAILVFLKRWSDALAEYQTALSLKPLVTFYFDIGQCKRNCNQKLATEGIADLQYFIDNADKDDRSIPSAYYTISYIYLSNGDTENSKKYFALGEVAEDRLLEFFKPYDFGVKTATQNLLKLAESRDKNVGNAPAPNQEKPVPKGHRDTKKLLDPTRIESRLRQRQVRHQAKLVQASNQAVEHFSFATSTTSKAPKSLANLKPIYIADLDHVNEKVYEGRIISGILIEPGYHSLAVHSILEDAQGQSIVISFYNLGANKQQVTLGQRVDILNPYIRRAADGTVGLRVDDPKSVFFGEKEDVCYYCTKSKEDAGGKLLLCAKCKNVRYCSKECQVDDWNVLEHKSFCSKK